MPPDRTPGSRRNLVNLEAVTKGYGTTVLLDAVSLGMGEGDRVGVVGRNGGGKSTLLGILTRSVPPDSVARDRRTSAASRRPMRPATPAIPMRIAVSVKEARSGSARTRKGSEDPLIP